jgi:membrane associated rhomboid family serine protease
MQDPITLIIIAITCLLSWLAFSNRTLANRLILWPPAVNRQRQYDRLLTYGFIHANASHLLFNMITLFFFGGLIEQIMRRMSGDVWTYPLFYLSALVVAILPSYIKNRENPDYRSLGASGAVSAMLFAFILISPWSLIYVFGVPIPAILYAVLYVAYSVWMSWRGTDNINHSAHLVGAAFGVAFMLLIHPQILPVFLAQLMNPHFGR